MAAHARLVLVVLSGVIPPCAAGDFTERLIDDVRETWDQVVHHPFTDQVASCTVDKDHLRAYLIQDHRFLDSFSVLLASMIAKVPSLSDRVPGAQFLALILGKENTYFQRALQSLGVDDATAGHTPEASVTTAFKELMRGVADSGRLELMLAVLVVAELSYLSWATRVEPAPGIDFVCQEWIDLHRGEYFTSVVDYLTGLLNRVGKTLTQEEKEEVRTTFAKAVKLEKAFFDMALRTSNPRDEL